MSIEKTVCKLERKFREKKYIPGNHEVLVEPKGINSPKTQRPKSLVYDAATCARKKKKRVKQVSGEGAS